MSSIAAIYKAINVNLVDYPLEASIRSSLDFCDEVCISVGKSIDGTEDLVISLANEFPERVKYVVYDFIMDRWWQEKAIATAIGLTKCDWVLLIDADEVFNNKEDILSISDNLNNPRLNYINLKIIHLYGTPNYQITCPPFYSRHPRIGRRNTRFCVKNLKTDVNNAPVCELMSFINGQWVNIREYQGSDLLFSDTCLYHYGWCRNSQAMTLHNKLFSAWYANTPGVELVLPSPYNFRFKNRFNNGDISKHSILHSKYLLPWFLRSPHPQEWNSLEEELVK